MRAKTWKQPKYPSIDEWINKMWPTYLVDYYLDFKKRKETATHVTIWMNLEDFMPGEISSSQKDNY